MKTTIKAREGYRVRTNAFNTTFVYDGDNLIMCAQRKTIEEYEDNKVNNEMFKFCECFETVNKNKFIYWVDFETGEDF